MSMLFSITWAEKLDPKKKKGPLHFFKLWAVSSHDLSQTEKKTTIVKAEQIHKMTTNFTQNENVWPFWVKIIIILWIYSPLTTFILFSGWNKSRGLSANSSKLEEIEWAKGNPNSFKGKLLMGQLDKSMVGRGRGLRGKFLMDQLEINVDLLLVNSWPEHGMFIEYRISTKSLFFNAFHV